MTTQKVIGFSPLGKADKIHARAVVKAHSLYRRWPLIYR
ncbi:Transposase [Vibrio anguillarum 775]|nr:Transposase [Vibrio anguillarum 775]